jgi:hypothetical protein
VLRMRTKPRRSAKGVASIHAERESKVAGLPLIGLGKSLDPLCGFTTLLPNNGLHGVRCGCCVYSVTVFCTMVIPGSSTLNPLS